MESHPLDTLIPPSLPKTTLFENVNVFDGSSDRLARNMNVLVRGNRIEQVTRQRPASPSNTTAFEVLRGEGRRTLMPGLIDLHVHPMFAVSIADSISEDRDYLVFARRRSHGGNADAGVHPRFAMPVGVGYGLTRAAQDDLIASPRIFHSGAILSQNRGARRLPQAKRSTRRNWGAGSPWHRFSSPMAWTRFVRRRGRNLRLGATQIKIMASGGGASAFDHLYSVQFLR